jgi:hypothetical protein
LVSIPTIVWGDGAASGAALLPLIWSMGFAEWQLLLFRQRTFDVASNEMQLDRFGRRVTRLAVRGLTVYLGWLTVITVMVFGTAYAVPQWTALRPSVPAVAFGWVLGAAFYAALLSTSLSQVRAPVLAMAAGTVIPLMVIVSVPVWFPAGAGTTPPIASAAVIAAPVITVLCLLLPCLRAVTNPSRHL